MIHKFQRQVKTFGNGAHIVVPKEYTGMTAVIVIIEDYRISNFPKERKSGLEKLKHDIKISNEKK